MNTKEVTQIIADDFGQPFKLADTSAEAYAHVYIGGQLADTFKLYGTVFKIDSVHSVNDARTVFKATDRDSQELLIEIPNDVLLEPAD